MQVKQSCNATYFSPNNKNYHYSCLLLYKTHQSQYELLVPYQNYTKAFLAQHQYFDNDAIVKHNQVANIQNTVQRLRLSNFLDTNNDDLENMSDSGMYASIGQDLLLENIVHLTETSLSQETTDNCDRNPPCIANSTTQMTSGHFLVVPQSFINPVTFKVFHGFYQYFDKILERKVFWTLQPKVLENYHNTALIPFLPNK